MTRLAAAAPAQASPTKTNGNGHAHLASIERPDYDWDQLPKELRKRGHFVLWRNKDGRKVPYDPSNPTRNAASDKPATWSDFDKAERAYDAFPHFDGLNAICSPEFTFVDIDDCISAENHMSPWAAEIIDNLPTTYWEISPSRTGLHGIFRSKGDVPNLSKDAGKGVEVYAGKHFMSVTGWPLTEERRIGTLTPVHVEPYRKSPVVRATAPASETDGTVPKGQRTLTLLSKAGALKRQGLNAKELEAALRLWNEEHCSPPLDEANFRRVMRSVERWTAVGDLICQNKNDVGNAERLLLWGGGTYRYVVAFKRWAVYDGAYWPVEDRQQETIRREAQCMLRAFAAQANEITKPELREETLGYALGCEHTNALSNMIREAQVMAPLRVEEMDRDPLLVNFCTGTLDARTGKLREHRREDYITTVIPHDYNAKAQCPKWKKFIGETFGNDSDTIEFVQRALGYSLTGDTSEKCIFLANGPTNTAKTTLLSTVKILLGEYAGRIKVESLMVERRGPIDSNAQADLADLRGKRFVMTSETGEGQKLREELVKLLSQGQSDYKAVRKYENPFSFRESWKLWLDCNHLPVIRGTDDAIWERLVIVPFTHVVPKNKQRKKLSQQLVAQEAEGILAWLVEGLRNWRKKSLALPEKLRTLRKEWRDESDEMLRWMAESCAVEPTAKCKSTELYQSCQTWRVRNKLFGDSTVIFARKMVEHGFVKKEDGDKKIPTWYGVRLKSLSEVVGVAKKEATDDKSQAE